MLGKLHVGDAWVPLVLLIVIALNSSAAINSPGCRVLLDTDVDTDDFFALLYLLKLNRSQFGLKAVTINANGWAHAGHAVNHIYDLLYMMDRDDVHVGVGGDGGISPNGILFSNVGGYLPIIEQGMTTTGYCRYRQAIPVGQWGLLDIDTNFGIRKAFLPQGRRKYSPLEQPTTQQVMFDTISRGPTTVFLTGAMTNFALFLMSYPHLRKNVQHIYIMGGSVRSNDTTSCKKAQQCRVRGNLFTANDVNPYAEFNFFVDPFAAYQVIHSGIPITLVPLDATNTIPITKSFLDEFEHRQDTYEAQYCFKTLKLIHDISPDQFFKNYYLWDSFMAGIAASIMSKPDNPKGHNDFAEMEYMNITVHTSNEPYGLRDGSNPFFDGRTIPRFYLKSNGVHSGHVMSSLRDPFCLVKNGGGKCKDGYTEEISGRDSVRVLVATRAKPNKNVSSTIDKEFSEILIDVLNRPQQSGRFNFTTQFPEHKNMLCIPDFSSKRLGKPLIFDMDMSAGDILALLYLLKVPVEVLNLKAIFVTPTGWANAATIDVVYDVLHMMGRDDIPVGLGDVFATNQSNPTSPTVGDCKYVKAIPHGSGGFIDSDTLYGLARELPRSPRRYTANPELRQPSTLDIWRNLTSSITPETKITILSNGPLTTLAKILSSDANATSKIQDAFVVGGHINNNGKKCSDGNLFTVPLNKYAEFNMFLDPLAAKTILNSNLDVTMIPLSVQRTVSSSAAILQRLSLQNKTPELEFAQRLINKLDMLQKQNRRYQHTGIFVGEILGAVAVSDVESSIKPTLRVKPIRVIAKGDEARDGQTLVDEEHGRAIKVLESVNDQAYYDLFARRLGDENQSAMVQNCSEQVRTWREYGVH